MKAARHAKQAGEVAKQTKTATPARAAACGISKTEEVHPGVVCDRSGMSPIVGARYNLLGRDYDLCAAEFSKLDAREQALYTRVPAPAYRRAASPSTSSPAAPHALPVEQAKDSGAPAKESNVAEHPDRVGRHRVDLSSVTFVDKKDEAVTIAVATPGVAPADLDVRVLEGWLTLKGATTRDGTTFIVDRKIALPAHVDAESAHATHAHGEVTIVIKRNAGTRVPIRHLARGQGQRHLVAEAAVAPVATEDVREVAESSERDQPDVKSEGEDAEAASPKAESEEEEEWVPLAKDEKKVQ